MINYLALFASIAIASVAAWYSIVGLMSIFAAAALPIAIMGGVLEAGKLITASLLFQNWKTLPTILKTYLTTAVVILIMVTSMGIFGYLSKAHIDQTLTAGDNTLQIQLIDNNIEREKRRISDAEKVIGQLDDAVSKLLEFDRVRGRDGAIAVRKSQEQDRERLTTIINDASGVVGTLQQQRALLQKQQNEIEAEVGPIKYIAALIYGETDKQLLESAVRLVIMIIIFVFDPLAVLLLIAANHGLTNNRVESKIPNSRLLRKSTVEVDKRNIAKF